MPPIFIALLLLAGLLCWFVIGARGKWWLKLIMIVLVPTFMFVIWHSLASYQGWPTSNKPPTAALYVYGYVIEPDVNIHIQGAVYVWLIPQSTNHGTLDYAPKLGEPRAYRLPFSPQLEQQVLNANKAVAGGKQVAFSRKQGHGGHGYASGHQTKGGYKFYNLRPPVLPNKTHGN